MAKIPFGSSVQRFQNQSHTFLNFSVRASLHPKASRLLRLQQQNCCEPDSVQALASTWPCPRVVHLPPPWTNFLLLNNASYTLIFPPHLQSSIRMNLFSFPGWQLANECGMHVHPVQSSYETVCCLLQGPGTM